MTLEAMQIIEPKIESITSIFPEKYGSNTRVLNSRIARQRGGFIVKVSEQKQPILIVIMGEKIWLILELAIALVSAEGGVLLVDEIDTILV